MAVTHNIAASTPINGGPVASGNVTVAAGSQHAVLIGIGWSVIGVQFDEAISTVLFDGDDATFIHLAQNSTGFTIEHYYAVGFSSGVRDYDVAWTGTNPDIVAVVGVEVMDGVDQVTPIGVFLGAFGSSTTPSVTVPTTDTDGFVVEAIYIQFNTNTIVTLGAGQTARWNNSIGTSPFRFSGRGSTEPGGASGTIMSYVLAASRQWAICGTEFRPHVEPPVVDPGDVHVLTSYDYLEVSPDKLDRNDRLPEEARMVWIGRWRH